jgi:5-oxoprolinase (ATP-hydrolysing) subunit C
MISTFMSDNWRITDVWDRMGVRLAGPSIAPEAALDMPSEPIVRGSVQVAGDGIATVLLADHQTTGGYPKIATVLDCDLDSFVQLRPRDLLAFRPVSPDEAISLSRTLAMSAATYFRMISEPRCTYRPIPL